MASQEQRLVELEEERAGLELAKEEAKELAADQAAELDEGRARLEAAEAEIAELEEEKARMAAAMGEVEADRRELATLRERVARLDAANAALDVVLREASSFFNIGLQHTAHTGSGAMLAAALTDFHARFGPFWLVIQILSCSNEPVSCGIVAFVSGNRACQSPCCRSNVP